MSDRYFFISNLYTVRYPGKLFREILSIFHSILIPNFERTAVTASAMFTPRFSLLLLALVSIAFSSTVEDALISSSLLEAASKGDLEALAASVKSGDSIDTTNVNGWNAAMFTVMNGDIRGTQLLIEAGINLNSETTTGVTSLMMAASQSDKEIVEVRAGLGTDCRGLRKWLAGFIKLAYHTSSR